MKMHPTFSSILESYDLPYDVPLNCRNCDVQLQAGRFIHRQDYDFCSLECLSEYEQVTIADIRAENEDPKELIDGVEDER